jgi:hypothetical protein
MTTTSNLVSRFFRKHYALPAEHGAWIWWIGPFLLGLAAGGGFNPALGITLIGALAAFLLRQPTTLIVKVISGRRPGSDLAPAAAWGIFYSLVALGSAVLLVSLGYSMIPWLAIPGLPVFLWHLWLVSRKEERGQQGIELVGSGVLALAAPAAYWVSGGENSLEAWIIWALSWLQSAASIVYIYLRLHQRQLTSPPAFVEKWRMGIRALAYHTFNLALATTLSLMNLIPFGMSIAFALVLLDAFEGVTNPPIGAKPSAIGIRQLIYSSLFYLISAGAYIL